jgi:hypothetical protein
LTVRLHGASYFGREIVLIGAVSADLAEGNLQTFRANPNSYKHAFPGGFGSIDVGLRRSVSGDEAVLTVDDDGPGFIERPGTTRHGLGLVRRLMEQVDGSAELRSERGTGWTFRFPVTAYGPSAES